MTEDPREILKRRLAEGAISIDQYRELLGAINETSAAPTATEGRPALGKKLVEVDDLALFEECLVKQGKRYALADVTSVRGGRSSSSFNFVPTDRSTSLSVAFSNEEVLSLAENRVIFGGSRHEAISQMLSLLRHLTLKPRLTNLVLKLKKEGTIELFRPIIGSGESVRLTKEGWVQTSSRAINLKQAKASGTFGIGSEWRSLRGSYKSDPNEVILSEKRGFAGALIPSGALRFTPWVEDPDIVHRLLEWMAEPGHDLH